jgi:hypothetical protein
MMNEPRFGAVFSFLPLGRRKAVAPRPEDQAERK